MLRRNALNAIAAEVAACQKCPLWRTRTNAVPGEGGLKNRIVFVGEAPGRSEDVKGKPFVGAAGRLLDSQLLKAGLSRTDVFICNVLKCRPPENRQPKSDEIEACTPYLDRQIGTIKPRIIVTLGRHSTAHILRKASLPFEGITEMHGRPYRATIFRVKVVLFPMLHPAAALYKGEYRRELIGDFGKLKCLLAERGLANG